jgi:hypothetical protein
MRRIVWLVSISLRPIVFSIALLVFASANALAQGWSPSMPGSSARLSARLPANYRTLMARYLRDNFPYRILDARITPIYERWGGILRGGSFACVCVVVLYNDKFFGRSAQALVLTMDKGRVTHWAKGIESCSPLRPFPELRRR